jgi:hypothetical protein
MNANRDNSDEAREILRRVETDNASYISGTMEKAGTGLASHFAARDAEDEGASVKWAARIGRALGAIAFVILVINLFTGWFF